MYNIIPGTTGRHLKNNVPEEAQSTWANKGKAMFSQFYIL